MVYRVTGTPYIEYVHANIIEPLGLASTVFDLTDELRPHFFVGYNPTPYQDCPERAPYAHLNGISSAGQLHSTSATWQSGYRSNSKPTAESAAEHRYSRAQHLWRFNNRKRRAGLVGGAMSRLARNRIGDHIYHNHGGGIHGFGTQVWFNVPRKTGVVVLINMWPPPGGLEIAQEVLEMVLNADEAVPLVPEQPALAPTPEALRRFVGYYRAEPGLDVDIEVRDGSLRLCGSRWVCVFPTCPGSPRTDR